MAFRVGALRLTAVEGASFAVGPGETLAIVGESGSGKSASALAIAGLFPQRRAVVTADTLDFEGKNLLGASPDEMRRVRGNRLGMVFQDPMTSLNPVMTIGEQIAESLVIHKGMTHAEARRRAVELLQLVRIPAAPRRCDDYPFALSGGMRQRVMIAVAIACNPTLLIADEPTTALDVTTQAQILELLGDLQRELGMAIVLITHDLGVVAEVAHRVAVMYFGRVVEYASTDTVLTTPQHPYTIALLKSVKSLHASAQTPLYFIPGAPPPLAARPRGCAFSPRCGSALPECAEVPPPVVSVGGGHDVSCILPARAMSGA